MINFFGVLVGVIIAINIVTGVVDVVVGAVDVVTPLVVGVNVVLTATDRLCAVSGSPGQLYVYNLVILYVASSSCT